MPIVLKEIEVLCNADKRKSTNELPFVSAPHASRFIFEMEPEP